MGVGKSGVWADERRCMALGDTSLLWSGMMHKAAWMLTCCWDDSIYTMSAPQHGFYNERVEVWLLSAHFARGTR